MATIRFTFSTRGSARHGICLAIVLSTMILSVAPAAAQEDPTAAPRAVRQGIELFKKQDFEEAAKFFAFAQARQQGLGSTDMQDLATFSVQNGIALKNRQDGAAQLRLAADHIQANRMQDAALQLKSLNANQYLGVIERQQLNELNARMAQVAPIAPAITGKTDAKSLLASGRAALQAGDLAGAEALATQADKASSLMPNWLQPWNDSPAKLRRDIQAAKAKQSTPSPIAETKTDDSSWMPSFGKMFGKGDKKESSASDKRVDAMMARQMVKDGYTFLQANDIDKARLLASEAKKLNIAYEPGEPTADMLLKEIQVRTGGPVAPVGGVKTPAAKAEEPLSKDPRVLVKQGRSLMAEKKYEQADKVCTAAAALNGRWGLFEDTPDKLRRDLQKARASHERDESVKLMVDARKHFTAEKYDEAERKAFKAKQLHGPYGVFDFGDRPDKLLEEITRVRQAKGLPTPARDALAKDTPAVPAGIMNANKNRAIVMLREAGEYERQGMMVEARQKAIEARALKAAFAPGEESPESVLQRVYANCDRQISGHLNHAAGFIAQTADPQRLDKAMSHLSAARKLAQSFELDLGKIDQTAHYVQQVAAGNRPLTNVAALGGSATAVNLAHLDMPTGDPKKDAARKRLQHAQTELAHGKTTVARKIAEELYNPEYGIQAEALALIRSISAEEYNQQTGEAKRTFDAGFEAFKQNEFKKAMFIFRSIDTGMLPMECQARLRDIMATREMQPTPIQLAQGTDPQKLSATPIVPNQPALGSEPNLIDQVKAKDLIQYQALRQRGLEAMRTAHDMYKNKQRDQAIDLLNQYVEQVKVEGLGSQKTADLCRVPEMRVQQYRTMMADEKLKEFGAGKTMFTNYSESDRTEKIKARQQELVEKMKLVGELMRQGKLKEADAEVTRVLEIDRDNVAAISAKMIINTRRAQEKHDNDVHANEKFFMKANSGELGNFLDTHNPIELRADYVKKGRTVYDEGLSHNAKDPKTRAIEYRLKQPISLNFRDVPLEQAIKDLTVTSGVQVQPDYAALDEARVNLQSPLSISVENVDMKSALNLMLNRLKLSYTIENQVLMITTPEKTQGRHKRITYPIADLIVAVPDHPLPDSLNMQKALERSMSPTSFYPNNVLTPPPYAMNPGAPVSSHSGGLGSAFGQTGQGHGMQGPVNKERTKEEMANVLKDLIQDTISKSTWEKMGGTGNIQYFPMGMALVITQPQEVQEEVQLLLATLRRLQDLQVSVELRAVLVSESFFERIGVDFDMNIRTPTSRNEPSLLAGQFVNAPFANRTGAGLNGLISGLTPAGTLTPDLGIPLRNSTFNFTTPQFGGYQPEAGLSLGLAFLSDIQVFMFLEAVAGDRRAHIMQAPKLTVFNGQTATIGGFNVRPIVSGVQPIALPNGNFIMVPQINQMPYGLTMTVQPVVSPDRRFIRLNVTPQLTAPIQDPTGAQVIAVPTFAPGFFDGNIPQPPLANQPLNVNVLINQQGTNLLIANTTVNVPDGGTVLLGGFKFMAEERTEYGPPILSKIPYLSRLFRNVGWSRDGSTLIYLVTARVIMVEEEERIFMGELPPIPR